MASGRTWRTGLKWTAIAIGAVVAVVLVAGYLTLSSSRFQNWVRQKAEIAASRALGTPVRIAALRWAAISLSPSADLSGVTVAGRGAASAPPLLSLDHAHVTLHITSLLHRTWRLTEVRLDHPVVHLRIDRDGSTNLPQPPVGRAPGPDVFQLAVGHFSLRQGEVYINEEPQSGAEYPIAADLRQLGLEIAYQPATRHYAGRLGYQQGSVSWEHHQALPHQLALSFDAGRQRLQIPSLTFTSPAVYIAASAVVSSYVPLRLAAGYQAQVDVAALRPLVGERNLPRGTVAVSGDAHWQDGQFTAQGRFRSAGLTATAAALRVPVSNLEGEFQFARRDLTVSRLRAAVLGGTLTGTASVEDVGGGNRGRLAIAVQGAQLQRMERLAGEGSPRGIPLQSLGALGITGTAAITTRGQWQRSFATLALHTEASLQAQIQQQPLAATLNFDYQASPALLTLTDARLQAAGLEANASGTISAGGAGQIAFQVHSANLSQAEALAAHIAQALDRPLPALALAGQGSVRGTVSGALRAPRIAAQVQASPLDVRGVRWQSLSAAVSADPAQVQVSSLTVTAGGGGRLTLDATLGLSGWRPGGASRLTARFAATQFALVQLAPLVPGPLPVTGLLRAQASVHGTLAEPQGDATVAVTAAHLHLGGQQEVGDGLQSFTVQVHGAGRTIAITAAAQLLSGPVTARGTLNYRTRAWQGEVHADQLVLDRLPALTRRRLPISGVVALHGAGQGTLAAPQFQLTATTPQLQIAGQTITGLNFTAQLQQGRVHAVFTATALKTTLHAQADLGWGAPWPIQARFDAPAIPIAPLLVAFAPQQAEGVHGQTELHASLSGPLAHPEQLQAQLALPAFTLTYRNLVQLRAAQPIEARLAQGVVTLLPAHLTGTETDLRVAGSIPLRAQPAAMHLTAQGTVNAKLLEAFFPGLSAAGAVQLAVNATGGWRQPQMNGTIEIANLAISNPEWPVGMQNGQGSLRLHNDRMDVTRFTAAVGGGTLSLSGGLTLAAQPRFNLAVAARQVRFRLPNSLRDTVNADLVLNGSLAAALLSGRAQVVGVAPVPGFDFATLANDLTNRAITLAAPDSFLRVLRLDVAVSTPNQIAITSRDFSLRANANLNLRGTGDDPVILGRMDVTSGDIIFRGNRFVMQAGTVDFVNPTRTVANLSISADATIDQYNLHLRLQGPADNLRTTYSSEPALPPADIISLLAFGQTGAAGSVHPLPGNLGAETLVASAVTSQITDRVEKLAGISHLSVDPVLGGAQSGGGARITLQQRVTGNLYVTVSTDLNSTQRDVIEIQYHFNPRVSAGFRKQNGGVGASLQFKKTWH